MATVLVAVATFTLAILVLVGALLLAWRALVPTGPVVVGVNAGTHEVPGQAGDTLLALLSQAEIFLPAACGGQGTCGTCRVRVERGGGSLLPTEKVHISKPEAREGWRLACQVKVKQSLDVQLPPEVFGVERWRCTVRSARNVSTFIRELVLDLPEGEEVAFRAGGYMLVESPPHTVRFADFDVADEYRPDWERYGLFDLISESGETVSRAYSMANAPLERGTLMFNVRISTPPARSTGIPPGVCSSYIFGLRPGDEVMVTGPFGDFYAEESDAEMVFIGGGAGMAPMRSHILDQLERIGTNRRITFWYGARSIREAFYVDLFTTLATEHENFDWYLALSDPAREDLWDGDTGFIHQVLFLRYLRNHHAPEDVEYYLCGPPVMITACRKMLDDLGVESSNIKFDDFGS